MSIWYIAKLVVQLKTGKLYSQQTTKHTSKSKKEQMHSCTCGASYTAVELLSS